MQEMSAWQRWLYHPERSSVRHALFQLHLWMGAASALYVLLISVTGSLLVFGNQLSRRFSIQWLIKLHSELLLSGGAGRAVNGLGAMCIALLCVTGAIIWWPGAHNWRRGLMVNWKAHVSRVSWDVHSALGFWFFLFVLGWALSGIYFAFPRPFDALYRLDPRDRYTDPGLYALSQLHFGRFGWFSEVLWTVFGLVPAALAYTGVFICCHRLITKKSSNPHTHPD